MYSLSSNIKKNKNIIFQGKKKNESFDRHSKSYETILFVSNQSEPSLMTTVPEKKTFSPIDVIHLVWLDLG